MDFNLMNQRRKKERKAKKLIAFWFFEQQIMGSKLPSKPFQLLYLGYIISCIGDRLWTFAIIFVLQRLGGMRLVGINQLFESVSAMLLASYVGKWLDLHDRRNGTLTVLTVNNISVAISAALLAICLSIPNSSMSYVIMLSIIHNILFIVKMCIRR
jgi:hypothetical protein